jgi:hypothetical protein
VVVPSRIKGVAVSRRIIALAIIVVLAALGAAPVRAAPFPSRIDLPNGFAPEGIAIARGVTFYTGSLVDGAIYRGSVRSGRGDVFIEGREGRVAVGMKVHKGLLWVAGGDTGDGYVYDARSGDDVASYSFTEAGFVNDVIVTKDAAWFTDSINPVLYKVPVSRNGDPSAPIYVEVVPLTGDIVYQDGFNVNGIDATRNGRTLIIVQSNTGMLFSVDASSGEATEIDLGGEDVTNGDGILLDGKRLYVVQNQMNQVAKVRLSPDLSSGEVVGRTGHSDFDVPTTVAKAGRRLYLPNARFGTDPTPETEYWITKIRKP